MTDARPRPRPQVPAFVKALLAIMIGILAGGVINFMLGDQGADTPAFSIYGGALAFSIYGGALAFAIFLVWGRWKARKARDD